MPLKRVIPKGMGLEVSIIFAIDKDNSDVRATLVRVSTGNICDLCRVLEDDGDATTNEYRVGE